MKISRDYNLYMADTSETSKPKTGKSLTREFLSERDLRIFKMRCAGIQHAEIARRFGMSTASVGSSIRRQLERLNSEALIAYPEVLRMELERLDSLQNNIWPQTQHRKHVDENGTEIMLEPDLKAVDRVLAIMNARSRLVGLERQNVSMQIDVISSGEQIRATLAGAVLKESSFERFSPESEARKLIALMASSGVISPEILIELSGGKILDAVNAREDLLGSDSLALGLPVGENEDNNNA